MLGSLFDPMASISGQILPTGAVSVTSKTQDEVLTHRDNDPRTLLALLHRAARYWPSNGIMFKDQGWEYVSDFVTYADLLRQAEVFKATEKHDKLD